MSASEKNFALMHVLQNNRDDDRWTAIRILRFLYIEKWSPAITAVSKVTWRDVSPVSIIMINSVWLRERISRVDWAAINFEADWRPRRQGAVD